MKEWIKPSEVQEEGQYLVAVQNSDYLRVNEVYRAEKSFYVVSETLGDFPPPKLTDQFSDERYRFYGPVRAPIF